MPAYITEAEVGRPSFLGGGEWTLKGLRGVNVLFGRNGSGKSFLLRKLRDVDPKTSHYIVPERSGDISFEPGLIAEVIEAVRRQGSSQSNFLSNYRQHVVTRIQGYYTRRGSKRVADIKHDPEDLLKTMSLVLPDFTVQVKSESPFYDLRRAKDGSSVTSVSSLSSGESQLLSLGLDIVTIVGMWELDAEPKRLLLVDEPDAHIHPDLQIKLADFLCHIAREFNVQVFVATHSTTLLAALGQFGGDDAAVMFVAADKADVRAEPFSAVSRELAALLGGHLLMGPLFGGPRATCRGR
jgi:energy-coupling factor transporter ATP-binding protein EcfA2